MLLILLFFCCACVLAVKVNVESCCVQKGNERKREKLKLCREETKKKENKCVSRASYLLSWDEQCICNWRAMLSGDNKKNEGKRERGGRIKLRGKEKHEMGRGEKRGEGEDMGAK